MLYGYHGQYLRIDLDRRVFEYRPIPEDILRQFVGGGGLGTWLLLQECPPGVEACAPEAPLLFVFSPLVGSPLTTSAKFSVLAKSPLTDRINDSLSSSHFAIAGKKTGVDAICITGRSSELCWLRITPEGVSFEGADALRGLSSEEAQRAIRSDAGSGFRVAAIGPAGERGVRYATISNDGRHAGRGGLGAVMGSKNLKAIAVQGDRLTTPAHVDRLLEYSKKLSRESFGRATAKYRELGTVSNLLVFNRLGTLPTRNFQEATFAEAERLAPENLSDRRLRESCAACTIGCEHLFEPTGTDGTPVRMEYESLYALGPLCGISDPNTVLAASRFCDEAGIDTISAGASVAFAMECAERGLIQEPGLRFGSGDALLQALEKICRGEGLGSLLARGTRAAAEEIGGGSADFAPHVKGLELPGYDPRGLQTMALGFAVGTRGADHNRSGAYQIDFSEQVDRLNPDESSVALAIAMEDEAAVMDSLILCKFLRGVFSDRFASMAEMLHLITGWDVSGSELQETARRIVSAKKEFNIREGWTPAEDRLPRRFFDLKIPSGASAGGVLTEETLQRRIELYNLSRGWTRAGWLTSPAAAGREETIR